MKQAAGQRKVAIQSRKETRNKVAKRYNNTLCESYTILVLGL